MARSYGGVSAEDRRLRRRGQLMAAGLELLGAEGAGGTTVRAVCTAAGLHPRYFYESFENLDALRSAVFEDAVARAAAGVLAALAEATARPSGDDAIVRAAVSAFVDVTIDDPRVARVLFLEAHGSAEMLRRRMDATERFASLVNAWAQERSREDVDPTTGRFVAAGLVGVFIAWLEGPDRSSRGDIVDRCVDLALRVLGPADRPG